MCNLKTLGLDLISGQKAIAQNPNTKKMLAQPQNPTCKSVVFHTLVFCPWHRDRIPLGSHGLKILTLGPY